MTANHARSGRPPRLLEPGGAFIPSSVNLDETWVPYGAILAVMHWFGRAPVVHGYDRETIMREIREAGFVEVEEEDQEAGAGRATRSLARERERKAISPTSATIGLDRSMKRTYTPRTCLASPRTDSSTRPNAVVPGAHDLLVPVDVINQSIRVHDRAPQSSPQDTNTAPNKYCSLPLASKLHTQEA